MGVSVVVCRLAGERGGRAILCGLDVVAIRRGHPPAVALAGWVAAGRPAEGELGEFGVGVLCFLWLRWRCGGARLARVALVRGIFMKGSSVAFACSVSSMSVRYHLLHCARRQIEGLRHQGLVGFWPCCVVVVGSFGGCVGSHCREVTGCRQDVCVPPL